MALGGVNWKHSYSISKSVHLIALVDSLLKPDLMIEFYFRSKTKIVRVRDTNASKFTQNKSIFFSIQGT